MRRSSIKAIILVSVALFINGCAETQFVVHGAKKLIHTQKKTETLPKTRGIYKIGQPYRIENTWYYPAENFNYVETGIASWYGPKFHGKKTANGEIYDMNMLTAAHRTLPMPCLVRVLNLQNGRSLMLRVNDRGPFARGRIIDVSRRAAQLLGFHRAGTARVRVEIIADQSQRLKLAALRGVIPVNDKIKATGVGNQPVERHSLNSQNITTKIKTAPANSRSTSAGQKSNSQTLVNHVQVSKTSHLYIQAGAFIGFANASKVRTELSQFGAAWLNEVKIGRQTFYRVRIGPIQQTNRADAILSKIISAGFPKARIIVD
ncbi:MAG: septal ring lytic transglycosylase RlpA family protein [Pseudomonadota bacterium]|nr:septal ring lytic transglycosylase RlpA family protein [Pseudomonadota bacterium]